MLKARKKNRVVRIPDEKKGEYEKLGYTITDEEGNVVSEPENKDATIAELRKENALLKQKLTEYELQYGAANAGGEDKSAVNDEAPAKAPAKRAAKKTE